MLSQPKWFSEEKYLADKLVMVNATRNVITTPAYTLDQVKTAVAAVGGAWTHYEMFGSKESYLVNNMPQFLALKDAEGKVVFDPKAYCESKLLQLKSSGYTGSIPATWQELAVAINGQNLSLYDHYVKFGQAEGLVLNAGFNTRNFYEAKLAYVLQGPDAAKYKGWTWVDVAKYYAENNLDAYENWITYGTTEKITADMVADTGAMGGKSFFLTTGQDNIVGTGGSDTFVAYAFDNTNALQTGDMIDGGTGVDTLLADVVGSSGIDQMTFIMPITNSVEIAKFTALTNSDNGGGTNNTRANIDAQRMIGTTEFWSTDSRASLTIEDVRNDSNKTTVVMQNTDPGQVDYKLYFNPQNLKSDATKTSGTLILQLIDTTGALNGKPLQSNPYDLVGFHYNGQYIYFNFGKISGDSTYEQLKNAIEVEVKKNPLLAGVTVDLGPEFTKIDGNTGNSVTGREIILKSPNGTFTIDSTNPTERDGWGASGILPPTTSEVAHMANSGSSECPLIQTNIALDNVARVQWDDTSVDCLPDNSQWGSTAGDMVVGSMATRGGVERFDVTVDRGSWLNSLSSTNNSLRMITVKAGDINGDGSYGKEQLFIGANPMDQTYVAPGRDLISWQDKARVLATQAGAKESGIKDVKIFDASAYSGNVNIAAEFTAEAYKKYLADVDGLRSIYDKYAPGGAAGTTYADFNYIFGAGNDTINMKLNGGIAADRDFILNMQMGEGNNFVNHHFDFKSGNQVIDQTNLNNVHITAGAGDDVVRTWGKHNANGGGIAPNNILLDSALDDFNMNVKDLGNHVYNGASGYVDISTGAGSNVVYAGQDMTVQNSVWVLNASGYTNSDPLGINYDPIKGAQSHFNNVTSENDVWTVGTGAAIKAGDGWAVNTTYTLSMKISFLGMELPVINLDTFSTGATLGSTAWTINASDINAAVMKAINNDPVLSKLLVVKDGAGNSLLVESLIDGMFDTNGNNGLSIDFLRTNPSGANTITKDWNDYLFGYLNKADATKFDPATGAEVNNIVDGGVSVYNLTSIVAGVTHDLTVAGALYTMTAATDNNDTLSSVLFDMKDGNGKFLWEHYDITVSSDGTSFSLQDKVGGPQTVFDGTNVTSTTLEASTGSTFFDQNVFNVWADSGADAHYYGYTKVTGGAGTDVLVTGYADAEVYAGAGNDTIIVGDYTKNFITAGAGADDIILGAGINGTKDGALSYHYVDTIYQNMGDSGTFATPATNVTTFNVANTDLIWNFDTVKMTGTADIIRVSDYNGVNAATDTAKKWTQTSYTPDTSLSDIKTTAADADNDVQFIVGYYNDSTGTFTVGAVPGDRPDLAAATLVVYDSNSALNQVTAETVVLVGVTAVSIDVAGDGSLTVATA